MGQKAGAKWAAAVGLQPMLPKSDSLLAKRFQLSFYDANIVACAVLSGAPALLTEDMHSGLLIDGLVMQNPFKQIY